MKLAGFIFLSASVILLFITLAAAAISGVAFG